MRYLTCLFVLLLGLAACTDPVPRGGGEILVLGDSVLAWNGRAGAAIPDVLQSELGRDVTNRAVPGAQFDNGSAVAGAVGFDIQRQFPKGRWNWIVMNGGANDVSSDCACGACDGVLNALIGPEGITGAIPAFLDMAHRQSGAQILWMGYYAGNGKGSFEACRDELVALDARVSRLAASRKWLVFVDAEDVIDPRNPAHYDPDNTHPSPLGSARIGAYLAQAIAEG